MPRKKTTATQVSVGDEAPASEQVTGEQVTGEQAAGKQAPVRKRSRVKKAKVLTARAQRAAARKKAARGAPSTSGLPRTAPTEGKLLYQFKITLLDIEPPIWRLIQVADGTLADLHYYIQVAFGWEDDHLHAFATESTRYGPAGYGDGWLDEADALFSELIPARARRRIRWIYEYDFGDCWLHEILFDGYPPADPKLKYPRCVAGQRACPPEDCGGTGMYGLIVEALDDHENPKNKELLEWVGPFDPEDFDIDEATEKMRARKSR